MNVKLTMTRLWILLVLLLPAILLGCGSSEWERTQQSRPGVFMGMAGTAGSVWRVTDTLPETGTIVHLYVTERGVTAVLDPLREPAQ